MKRLYWTGLLALGCVSAQAGGCFGHWGGFHRGWRTSFWFDFGPPAYCETWPGYAVSYGYAPGYAYYPAYGYGYGYARPNNAVRDTLGGALIGGLIGNSIHHQGWEGAGIGAAAGLLLGSLADSSARSYPPAYSTYHSYYYTAPAAADPPPNRIANAPTVNEAPRVAPAPRAPAAPKLAGRGAESRRPTTSLSAMRSADKLFGR